MVNSLDNSLVIYFVSLESSIWIIFDPRLNLEISFILIFTGYTQVIGQEVRINKMVFIFKNFSDNWKILCFMIFNKI